MKLWTRIKNAARNKCFEYVCVELQSPGQVVVLVYIFDISSLVVAQTFGENP